MKTGTRELHVVGTWDFKWPQDSRIRFAFQRPPDVSDAEFGEARSKVMALARLWLRDVDGCKPRIDIVDTGITLPAPSVAQRGRQNRSATGSLKPGSYEVLVSLARMPITRIDPLRELEPSKHRDRYFEHHTHPFSELGSYALRVDLGVPSVYLGPMQWYCGTLPEYFDLALARFVTLHEIGHVLGLGHEHQSPKARQHFGFRYKSAAQIFEIANARLGLHTAYREDLHAFVHSEIIREWPGHPDFSDWRDYGKRDELRSVMTYPFHDCLLVGQHHPECTPRGCPIFEELLMAYQQPTTSDLNQLAAMYGSAKSS